MTDKAAAEAQAAADKAAAEKAEAEKAAAEKAASDPAELVKQIAALNQENAQRRTSAKELQDKLDKIEEANKAAELKAAEETGEFKKLYEELKASTEKKEASANDMISTMEAALEKMLEAELANIPEAQRAVLDKFDNVSAKLDFIATAKETGLFKTTGGGGPNVREPDEKENGTIEAQIAAAEKDGNVLQVVSLKRQKWKKEQQRSN